MTTPCTCGGLSHVKDSRRVGDTTRRIRKCRRCGKQWTTIEVTVVKEKSDEPV